MPTFDLCCCIMFSIVKEWPFVWSGVDYFPFLKFIIPLPFIQNTSRSDGPLCHSKLPGLSVDLWRRSAKGLWRMIAADPSLPLDYTQNLYQQSRAWIPNDKAEPVACQAAWTCPHTKLLCLQNNKKKWADWYISNIDDDEIVKKLKCATRFTSSPDGWCQGVLKTFSFLNQTWISKERI